MIFILDSIHRMPQRFIMQHKIFLFHSLWLILATAFLFTPFAVLSPLLLSTCNEYIFGFNQQIACLNHHAILT